VNGKVQIETLSSLVLKDNPLGDPRRREIPIYLPPSYGTARGRRYPVLYWLPGFTGGGRSVVNHNPWKENLAQRLDRLIAAKKAPEAILVIADCFTAYGGSQYLNSSATGRYEDHLVQELVAFVDDKLPTVKAPEGRAAFGGSSGGFGALNLGMKHPGVFGHIYAHSADAGFDLCYPADLLALSVALTKSGLPLHKYAAAFRASRTKKGYPHPVINALAMSACYSPNPKSPAGFDLPVDPRTGRLIPAVWKRWEALDPVNACARHAAALKSLKTLAFDAGERDEFHLQMGARRLSDALKALKVPHTYEEHEFGHMDLQDRYDLSLALLSRRCARHG
jgi:enterochelin esterase family protein